jgi:hypothetical protein
MSDYVTNIDADSLKNDHFRNAMFAAPHRHVDLLAPMREDGGIRSETRVVVDDAADADAYDPDGEAFLLLLDAAAAAAAADDAQARAAVAAAVDFPAAWAAL